MARCLLDFFSPPQHFPLTSHWKYCMIFCVVKLSDFTFYLERRHSVKNQAYRMALLYDFYGDILTDRQKEFYDLY